MSAQLFFQIVFLLLFSSILFRPLGYSETAGIREIILFLFVVIGGPTWFFKSLSKTQQLSPEETRKAEKMVDEWSSEQLRKKMGEIASAKEKWQA